MSSNDGINPGLSSGGSPSAGLPSTGLPSTGESVADRTGQHLRLTDTWDNDEGGARMVAAALDALPSNYFVFHGVGLPGTKATIAHLVVGPSGVVAIDSKYYEGVLKPGGGTLWRGKSPIRKECEAARWAADVLSTTLQQPVDAVLCIAEATMPEPIIPLDRVVVCSPEALPRFLLTMPARLDDDDVDAVAAAAAPWVRSTAPRTIVSVSTTPDVTTGSSRPGALPRREINPQRMARSFDPDAPRRRYVPLLVPVALGVIALGGLLASKQLGDDDEAVASTTTVAATTATTASTVAQTVASTAPATVATLGAPLPPTVEFSCPSPGDGWSATAAPTEYRQDPDGFHLWYQVRALPYQYWGHFKSGLLVPDPLGGLVPGEQISVRIGLELHADSGQAEVEETFTAPTEPC